jgi:hypothetical protein
MKQLLLVGDRNDGLAPTAHSTPQSSYYSPPWRPGRTPVPSAYEQEGRLVADLDLTAATGLLASRCRTSPM